MLNNREFRVRTVKIDKTKKNDSEPETEERINVDPNEITNLAKDFVTHAAVTVGIVFAGVKVVTAICDIAVKRTKDGSKKE